MFGELVCPKKARAGSLSVFGDLAWNAPAKSRGFGGEASGVTERFARDRNGNAGNSAKICAFVSEFNCVLIYVLDEMNDVVISTKYRP